MHTKIPTPYRYSISEVALVVRDAPTLPSHDHVTGVRGKKVGWKKTKQKKVTTSSLERYYNDVYKLLLAKLTDFDRTTVVTNTNSARLEALVRELIKVKALLEMGEQQSG